MPVEEPGSQRQIEGDKVDEGLDRLRRRCTVSFISFNGLGDFLMFVEERWYPMLVRNVVQFERCRILLE